MSLTVLEHADALPLTPELHVIGYFGDFSPHASVARPAFEAFAASHPDLPVYLVDVGRVRGLHSRHGVERVPSAVSLIEGRVFRKLEGAHSPEAWARGLLPHEGPAAPAAGAAPARPLPVVYTSPSCVWCGRVKSWLQGKGVAFREVDIAADPRAADTLVARSGQMGVPQIEIGGQFVIGFDREALTRLLGLAS